MLIKLSFFVGSLLLCVAWQTALAQGYKGIIPMHSTCKDVERSLGGEHCGKKEVNLKFPNEKVRIAYSTKRFEKFYGINWDVPPGTVIIVSRQFLMGVKPESIGLEIKEDEYEKNTNDIIGQIIYDKKSGELGLILTYGFVNRIVYYPSNADRENLLCEKSENQTSAFSQEQFAFRKKIIPLYSSRSDVEKVARLIEDTDYFVKYETDQEILEINYSEEKCVGHGWDIPANRVLSYISTPKQKLLLKDVLNENENLFRLADDVGESLYVDSAKGIIFAVRAGEDFVDNIKFLPLPTNSDLRCKGFPKYDLIAQQYPAFDSFVIQNVSEWDVGKIYNTLHQIRMPSNKNAYIFIYCKKGGLSECKELKKNIEGFAKRALKSKTDQLTIKFGGYRNEFEVETFLIPKDYPPPTERPLYSSEFVDFQ